MSPGSKLEQLGRAAKRGFQRPLRERMLFLHMPKCGGNSLRVALREAYSMPLSNSRRRFFHVSPRRSRRVAQMTGRPIEDVWDDLIRYHMLDERYRLFTGHCHWPRDLEQSFPDVHVVTMLRDPVSRFLSSYYYPIGKYGPGAGDSAATLKEHVQGERARRAGSTFTRMLAWAQPDRALDPDVLDLARRRLASTAVLGVLEDVPGFVADFAARFGSRLVLPHANVGVLRPRREREELTDSIAERIEQLVRPDRILYDFALEENARRRSRSNAR